MRHPFGLSMAALVLDVTDGAPVFAPGAALTFWNGLTDGTQYTDLTSDAAGESPMDPAAIFSSDGTDGYLPGQDSTLVWGPDGVSGWWVSADGGQRLWMQANDVGTTLDTTVAELSDLQNANDANTGLLALTPLYWPADPDTGAWSPRPAIAGSRIVVWVGPTSPPIGGDPEYMREGDQWANTAG